MQAAIAAAAERAARRPGSWIIQGLALPPERALHAAHGRYVDILHRKTAKEVPLLGEKGIPYALYRRQDER